jgi:glutamine amidotransferase
VTKIAVIDHGAGNLVSIAQGLFHAGATAEVVDSPSGLQGASGVVLPGVGSAAAAYDRIEAAGFTAMLRALRVPLLGVCVGLQLLFDGSEEDGGRGLGLIPGMVRRLVDTPRLPHIGWNDVTLARPDPLFSGVGSGETFYFVHSYAPVAGDPGDVVATSDYGGPFLAAARRGRVSGVQFHPERSGAAGLRILANFVAEAGAAADAA